MSACLISEIQILFTIYAHVFKNKEIFIEKYIFLVFIPTALLKYIRYFL